MGKRVAAVPALLDSLQVLHAASFGWAMACCAWQQDLAEDVLQEAYLRVLDGRARAEVRGHDSSD